MRACGIVALALAVPLAQAQSAVRVRGTITAVGADTLSVKSRDGRDLKLAACPRSRPSPWRRPRA
jgi:hypothetical protein